MDEIKNNMNICIYDEIDDILRYTKKNIFFQIRKGTNLVGGAGKCLAPWSFSI